MSDTIFSKLVSVSVVVKEGHLGEEEQIGEQIAKVVEAALEKADLGDGVRR